MELSTASRLADVRADAWNALNRDDYPFLCHGFLSALEDHGAVTARTGWQPHHLLVYDGDILVAAAPAYLKAHSWGEFVFDFAWADAYERYGGSYYPKLVSTIPLTPATGPRILTSDASRRTDAIEVLANGAIELANQYGLSSAHWLFPDPDDAAGLAEAGYSIRHGCQFHWFNPGYRDFDDFLDQLTSKKRKNIRRERRQIEQAGIRMRIVHGDEAEPGLWDAMHRFYRTTFERHGNLPFISRDAFAAIGHALAWRVVLIVAERDGTPIGGAICLRDRQRLYGRYWGCDVDIDGLHFEACYYQGIEYSIRHGLGCFEPGAQGEHKVARGFVPTITRSAHLFPDHGFQHAIDDFLARERRAVYEYAQRLTMEGPYRAGHEPAVADGRDL
jgi:predicted N-acyltransferase